MRKSVVRGLVVAGFIGSSMFVTAPAALADPPVQAGLCPAGWYGVWVGYQTPQGEKEYVVCVRA